MKNSIEISRKKSICNVCSSIDNNSVVMKLNDKKVTICEECFAQMIVLKRISDEVRKGIDINNTELLDDILYNISINDKKFKIHVSCDESVSFEVNSIIGGILNKKGEIVEEL